MYKIADLIIDVKCIHTFFERHSKEYYVEDKNADFTLSCTEAEIEAENGYGNVTHTDRYLEHIAISRKLAEMLPIYNAFVLHSACFDVHGVGVAFAAHSGTGKTTHMNRWIDYLGDKITIVNGDKPIVRFFEDEPNTPYAYGNPWNGKENMGNNMRTPLKHICFIERAETNFVEKAKKEDVVNRIFNQVYMPQNNPLAVVNTMQLIDRLLNSCNLWIIHCNMDDNAGEIAYNSIFRPNGEK